MFPAFGWRPVEAQPALIFPEPDTEPKDRKKYEAVFE
jgi:hypothetical protein